MSHAPGISERRPGAAWDRLDDEDPKLRVLVVEDEALVALVLEEMLDDLGCATVGVAPTVADALAAIDTLDLDGAILDVNLGGEKVFPVADRLERAGVPFAFSTGFGPADLVQRYPGHRLLQKPYPPEALANVLDEFRR